MATKKQNRAHVKRRVRRVLNQLKDFFTNASGKRLNGAGWGAGISRRQLQDRSLSEG